MHLVYYCIGVSIVNSWLLYRRHCSQRGIAKKNILPLLKFQTQIAHLCLYAGKVGTQAPQPKQGRPSLSPTTRTGPTQPKHYKAAVAIPQDDIRFDQTGHFPLFGEKQQRCHVLSRIF
jgi:hypothetical protein